MTPLGRNVALIGVALVTFGVIPHVQAFPGKCLLAVDGKTYLNGICSIAMSGDGSFSIADRRIKSGHFAYVSVDRANGRAQGYWNGVEAERHAHDDLGFLTKQGACWTNDRARICAYR